MNLFGKTLGPQEISALVFSLMALVIWVGALRGERRDLKWFRNWEAERKARRDAEIAAESGQPVNSEPKGPWG